MIALNTPVAIGAGGCNVAADEPFRTGAKLVEAVVEAAARYVTALHEAQTRPTHAFSVQSHAAQPRAALAAQTPAAARA